MFFDWIYYRKILAFTLKQKDWPGRNRMLARLLLVTPLATAVHTVFFLLDYLFFPRLWRQKVEQPVFIVGHARSGTTLLHRLMAGDSDRFSYFLYWETLLPSLLQKKLVRWLGKLDRLLGEPIYRRLKIWDDKTFGPYRHMHDMSLWNAEEDQFVMKHAFVTQQWSLDMPLMHEVDIFHIDELPASHRRRWMRHYRECVKRQLLLNGGNCIHLSKNPVMSGWVNAILEEFPDARIAVLMRDPANCIPSILKMMESTWRRGGWSETQYAASMETMTHIAFETFRRPKQALAAHPDTPQIVVDYRKLTTEPRQTLHAVYQALQLEIRPEFDRWLSEQESREKAHASKFSYDIDDYDVTQDIIEQELAEFYEQWGWPKHSGTTE